MYRRSHSTGWITGKTLCRMLTAALLTLALTLVSFGHRPILTEVQTTAYILAGGDMADLCGDAGDPHAAADLCAACIIGQTAMLPDPALTGDTAHLQVETAWHSNAAHLPTGVGLAAHPARAPPARDHIVSI